MPCKTIAPCTRKTAKFVVLITFILVAAQYLFNLVIVARTPASLATLVSMYKNRSLVMVQRAVTTNVSARRWSTEAPRLDPCPIIPPALKGHVTVNTQIPSWAYLEETQSGVLSPGGRAAPRGCVARHRVAVIIPFRDREIHLKIFLQNLHPFLQRQQLDYGVFVVELAPDVKFNRALLMNVGFVEALKQHNYQCFIFHDVDLLPEDDRNLYTCPQSPRHMSVAIDRLGYKLPYAQIFGGVSAITKEHFERINGFSNLYFGWGGEDDDIYKRILYSNLTVIRYSPKVARYKMLVHKKDVGNPQRFNLLRDMKRRFLVDGINSLNYTIVKKELRPLYTWILVHVDEKATLSRFLVRRNPLAGVKGPPGRPPPPPPVLPGVNPINGNIQALPVSNNNNNQEVQRNNESGKNPETAKIPPPPPVEIAPVGNGVGNPGQAGNSEHAAGSKKDVRLTLLEEALVVPVQPQPGKMMQPPGKPPLPPPKAQTVKVIQVPKKAPVIASRKAKVIDWVPGDFKGKLPDYLNNYDYATSQELLLRQRRIGNKAVNKQANRNKQLPNSAAGKANALRVAELQKRHKNIADNAVGSRMNSLIPKPPKLASQEELVNVLNRDARTIIKHVPHGINRLPPVAGGDFPETVVVGEKDVAKGSAAVRYADHEAANHKTDTGAGPGVAQPIDNAQVPQNQPIPGEIGAGQGVAKPVDNAHVPENQPNQKNSLNQPMAL